MRWLPSTVGHLQSKGIERAPKHRAHDEHLQTFLVLIIITEHKSIHAQ